MWGVFLEAHELYFLPIWGEIIQSSGGPRYLSTIPLKDSYLFKIVESVISFCLKKFSNSAILNRWESFSGMVDHVTYLPWGPYNFSYFGENFLVGWEENTYVPPFIFFPPYTTKHTPKKFLFPFFLQNFPSILFHLQTNTPLLL